MAVEDWQQFADLARSLSGESGFDETVAMAVKSAPTIVGGCDEAGVSLVHRGGRITTEAATGDRVAAADALQYELHAGPCVQSIHEAETVRSSDLRTEQRWGEWSRRASEELDFRAMLCVQLFTTGDTFGCLNLYSDTVNGFDDDDDLHAGLALAAHVAVAARAADTIEGLQTALGSRELIGEAKGRLSEKFGLTSEQAFHVLTRFSQDRNIKLRDVAEQIARHGLQ